MMTLTLQLQSLRAKSGLNLVCPSLLVVSHVSSVALEQFLKEGPKQLPE
jgi:hypothetical protein